MHVAVIDPGGALGPALERTSWPLGWRVTRHAAVPTDPAATDEAVGAGPVDLVVYAAHACAATGAMLDGETAALRHVVGPWAVADWSGSRRIPMIHMSGAAVFGALPTASRREETRPEPTSSFGRMLLAGEERVRSANPASLVLRTSWVFDSRPEGRLAAALGQARKRSRLQYVPGRSGHPAAASDVARSVMCAAARIQLDRDAVPFGVWHLAGPVEASERELLAAAITADPKRSANPPAMAPVRSGAAAAEDLDERLEGGRFACLFGSRPRSWRSTLDEALIEIAASRSGSHPVDEAA